MRDKMPCRVVPAPGVTFGGRIGIMAHRAHCEPCGFMSRRLPIRDAQAVAYGHNVEYHKEVQNV